jgi:hypothetical protein
MVLVEGAYDGSGREARVDAQQVHEGVDLREGERRHYKRKGGEEKRGRDFFK